jgi:dihydroorotate dehydrogenase (NAD+) catalytic subunit
MGRLKVKIGALLLSPPIMPASGTFGYGDEVEKFFDYRDIGAIVTKGLSLKPRKGNRMPRIIETPSGMINAIGLENIGVERFIKEKIPFYRKIKKPVIANIFGESIDEFIQITETLDEFKEVSGFEINISCPNVGKGGVEFSKTPEVVKTLIKEVRKRTKKFVTVKISPDSDYISISKICEEEGADAITAINTIRAMEIDIQSRTSKISRTFGGLSGPAIKPIALRIVYEISKLVSIPVIGVGGISSWEDAVQFFIAGASAVQIGTYFFVNNNIFKEVKRGLDEFLKKERISLQNLIGSFKPSIFPA